MRAMTPDYFYLDVELAAATDGRLATKRAVEAALQAWAGAASARLVVDVLAAPDGRGRALLRAPAAAARHVRAALAAGGGRVRAAAAALPALL